LTTLVLNYSLEEYDLKAFKYLIFFLILILQITSCSKNAYNIKFSDYKILYSQNPSITHIQKRDDWKPLKSLHFINLPSLQVNKQWNHGWIKVVFNVKAPHIYKGIYLNAKDLTDTLYINGIFVGSKQKNEFSAIEYLKPSLYQFPSSILKKGSNELLIRISLMKKIKGTIRSIELLTHEKHMNKLLWNNFLYEQFFFILIVMYFSLLIVQGTMYIVDRKVKIRLINVLFILYFISLIIILFDPVKIVSKNNLGFNFAFTYILLSASIMILYLMILLQSLFRIYLSQLNKMFIPIIIGGALVIISSNGHLFLQISIFALITLAGFAVLGYMLYLLNKIKPNPFLVKILIVEFALIVFVTIWQALSVPLELSIQCPDYLTWYLSMTYIFLGILYEAILTRRQRERLNRLYKNLKENNAKKKSKTEPAITLSSEEKLDTVIAFIKDNYTSDLSREGLASSVEMNPNYLSTLFNTYTGKKINDYINNLRIADAMNLMTTSEDKIIDIAFATGFESLSTFNRAFKNETSMSPSTYRKKKV